MNEKLLAELCDTDGVSGYESAVLEKIAARIKPFCDGLMYDRAGNLIAFQKGKHGVCADRRVLYSCHADEVGFVVTYIEEDGRLLFDAIGMNVLAYAGRRVLIGKNHVPGIVAVKPVHLLSGAERDLAPNAETLYLDIGAESRAEAEALSLYGEYAVFDSDYEPFGDRKVKAKALDDRAGCAMLISLLEKRVEYDAFFAFCVGEELGLRGSRAAAETVKPDLCINLECTTAMDLPGVPDTDVTARLGGGTVISYMDGSAVYAHPTFLRATALAEAFGIAYQTKTRIAGGTDAGSYTRASGGRPVLGLAAPVRYLHTAFSVADLYDLEMTERMLYAVDEHLPDFFAC